MKHFPVVRLLCFAAGLVMGLPCPAEQKAPVTTLTATIEERLASFLEQPRFAQAEWGVKVVSLENGRTLFEHRARKLLQPASNAKLYTAALALDRFGPAHRLRTSLYAAQRPDKTGTLKGNLLVFGRGDFSMATRFEGVAYTNLLDPLAQALATAGVKRIKGDLIGDDSYFRGPPYGSGWAWDDLQYYYGAAVSALSVQDNVVDLWLTPGVKPGEPCRWALWPKTSELTLHNRTVTAAKGGRRAIDVHRVPGENLARLTGQMPVEDRGYWDSASVPQPAKWFLMLFKEALARRGITVAGTLRTVNWRQRESEPVDYATLVELAQVESRPMSDLIQKMMKPSQNLYAQLLLLQAGARRHRADNRFQSTESLGIEEMNQFLAEAGVPKGDVYLEEGSGLSRGDRVTAHATVTLLQHMARHRYATAYRDALPIAGVDGSLKSRLKGTAAENNARAKTGTIRFVNTLSGYVTNKGGERLAFSLLLNNYEGSGARADLDTLIEMLADADREAPRPTAR